MSTVICVQIKKLRNLCSPFDIHGAWMPDGVITTCQIHVWLNLMPYWGIHIYLLVTCDLTSFLKFCTSSSSILQLGLPCSNTHHFVHLLVPSGFYFSLSLHHFQLISDHLWKYVINIIWLHTILFFCTSLTK